MSNREDTGLGRLALSQETRITLKAGILASLITSIIVFFFSVLWLHQTDITALKVNQTNMLETMATLKTIPTAVSGLTVKIEGLDANLKEHRQSSREKVTHRSD